MLSKDNLKEQIQKFEPQKQRFTIKKLSVGVASVLLGLTFAGATTVSANTGIPTIGNDADSDSSTQPNNSNENILNLKTAENSNFDNATNSNQKASYQDEKQAESPITNSYISKVNSAVNTKDDTNPQKYLTTSSDNENSIFKNEKLNKKIPIATVNNDSTNSQNNSNVDKDYSVVSDAQSLKNALSNIDIKGAIVKGDITVNEPLLINRDFVIKGFDGAVLNLGNNAIKNNALLTLKDITVNGSIIGDGSVNIEGTVNSNVDNNNSVRLTDEQLTKQIGNAWQGANINNWKSANIVSSKVNITQGSTLNINRTITGDGIALINGTSSFTNDGSTFGSTKPTNDNGTISVGTNAKLNINLKDSENASRANEQNISLDNASVGIRAENGNGHLVTNDSANVNINAGHGRAIVFGEHFGGKSAIHNVIFDAWQTPRVGNHVGDFQNYTNNSSVNLGDSTKLNITGREGLLLGDRATFVTGDHSIVNINNKGNGSGLVLGNFSKVVVSPQSKLLMTSNGKDCTGSYNNGNYIGMGDDGQFRVEHDATFKYTLTDRGDGKARPWDDNMNIISQSSTAHPLVYVGNNATFDGESDYAQFNGEIFSFSLNDGRTPTAFQIDGAKYVNLQRNADTSNGAGPVGGTKGQGNLYYSMGPGIIDASGQTYHVFKWNNQNLNGKAQTFNDDDPESTKKSINNFMNSADKYWKGITNLATQYSKQGNTGEFPGHNVSASDITGVNTVDLKTGTPANRFSDSKTNDTGFDPKNSQRLVLVATKIPTQEDKSNQKVTPFSIQIKENNQLKPGEVKLVQKGQDGLSRTTETTYYIVDTTTGEKTIDTSKGNNGHTINEKVINEPQNEIIEVGPQTATVKYYYQGGDANNNAQPISVNGQQLEAQITNIPVAIDNNGNILFNDNGEVIANNIDYNDSQDIFIGKQAVSKMTGLPLDKVSVTQNDWQEAVDKGTNKYNTGKITRDKIINTAEKTGLNKVSTLLPTNGPTYKVILGCDTWHNLSGKLTVNFLDKDTGKPVATPDQSLTISVQYADDDKGNHYDIRPNAFNNGNKVDLAEGQWNNDTSDFTYGYVKLPDLSQEGYKLVNVSPNNALNGDTVGGITTNWQNGYNATINVYYQKQDLKKNVNRKSIPSTQTVKYLDTDGNELQPDKVQNNSFNYSGDIVDGTSGQIIENGKWDKDTYTYKVENVPVIPGYVAISGVKEVDGTFVTGGLTATIQNPNVVDTVIYKKVGRIIPVTPDHQPIPNAPTPEYNTDPTNPKNVTPDEPAPTVPGYTPTVSNITPNDPTQDTQVVYTKDPVASQAKVFYIDDTTNTVLRSDSLDGNVGDKINYTTADKIDSYKTKGYILVSNNFVDGNEVFTPNDLVFKIHLKHDVVPVNPMNPGKPGEPINPNYPDGPKYPAGSDQVTKKVVRTIQYVDKNGNTISKTVKQPVTFTAIGVLDKVTGQWISPLAWTNDQTVDGVKTPIINGYHIVSVNKDANGVNVASKVLTHNDNDYTVTVTYAKNGRIIPVTPDHQPIPDAPTPQYNTDPNNPQNVVPNEPVPNIKDYVPSVQTVTPNNPEVDTEVVYNKPTTSSPVAHTSVTPQENIKDDVPSTNSQESNQQLPQTGNKSENLAIMGLATMSLAGLLAVTRKKDSKSKN
ncbi:mucin-binding protein [Limosilactobacillus albertensis]|uniref:YSIRK-type signal peptide-containing protein n=1 Tax=Limosilactobacillus albertensis TaxID=2759752 RepID=A0A839GYG6_9LACO|nr:YSIRK-type signal peptide-containing protein [Limosilactobacillus albertensis]MBB1123213.1 YSIRK-type signal peptide-containing protein [Limosilactobacillus albertensis]MCD7121782.1 YSIRK-type signal peptide-containing protein [Limosilactobacillus albertensis]